MGMEIRLVPGVTCQASNQFVFVEALLNKLIDEQNQVDEKKIQKITKCYGVNNSRAVQAIKTVVGGIGGVLIIPPQIQISQLKQLNKSYIKEKIRYNELSKIGRNYERLATSPDIQSVFQDKDLHWIDNDKYHFLRIEAAVPLWGSVVGSVMPSFIRDEAGNLVKEIQDVKKCRNNLKDFAKLCLDQVAKNQEKIVADLETTKKLNLDLKKQLAKQEENRIGLSHLASSADDRVQECLAQKDEKIKQIQNKAQAAQTTIEDLQRQVQRDQLEIQNLKRQLAEQQKAEMT